MNRRRKLLLVGVVSTLSGLVGAWLGYASARKDGHEFFGTFARVPEIEISDLAYAFAPSAQVVELIRREPPPPAKWAHTEERIELLRKLRLAVVAQSPAERQALLAQAEAMCGGCKPEPLSKMFQRFAQSRLVPPGNDIACADCKPARRRKELPRVE